MTLAGLDLYEMNPRRLYGAAYALMARMAGGKKAIDEVLEDWATARGTAEETMLGTTDSFLVEDQLDLMAMQPPAEKRR